MLQRQKKISSNRFFMGLIWQSYGKRLFRSIAGLSPDGIDKRALQRKTKKL
jgi:hypothetical protein